MNLWQYALLFLVVFLGGGLAFPVRKYNRRTVGLILSFSGAYLLGITVLHLIPSAFHQGPENIGIWVLAGFLLQLVLERLSRGVEHGHLHAHKDANWTFALQIMIGLCAHAFIEGMPLSFYPEMHAHFHEKGGNDLLFGIILHKAPAAFALVLLLLWSGFRQWVVILCLFVFASMSPLGSFLATLMQPQTEVLRALIAVVIGSFLHIATTILFEMDDAEHKISWAKLLVILAGFGLSLSTLH